MEEGFSHEELTEITTRTLESLLESDSLLSDLPGDATLEEVSAQLALQHGQSITVYVLRDNGEQLPLVVHLGATVLDVKRALKRYFCLRLKRREERAKVSWRYLWRSNHLVHAGEKLTDNNARLTDLGVRNRDRLSFVKKLREKNSTRR